jgi:hypothetical protein
MISKLIFLTIIIFGHSFFFKAKKEIREKFGLERKTQKIYLFITNQKRKRERDNNIKK